MNATELIDSLPIVKIEASFQRIAPDRSIMLPFVKLRSGNELKTAWLQGWPKRDECSDQKLLCCLTFQKPISLNQTFNDWMSLTVFQNRYLANAIGLYELICSGEISPDDLGDGPTLLICDGLFSIWSHDYTLAKQFVVKADRLMRGNFMRSNTDMKWPKLEWPKENT